MKPTIIKKPLMGALVCLFLLPIASGTETTLNICHPKYWEKSTVDSVENIRDIGHTCAKGRTLLSMAAEFASMEVILKLLEKGAFLNDKEKEALNGLLITAASNGHTDAIKTLAKLEAKVVNATGKYGKTAMMYAARNGHLDAIETLAGLGADVNATNNFNRTALIFAAMNGHTHAIETLAGLGADIDVTDNNGWTALMFAARHGHLDAIKTLAGLGADLDATDNDGNTAWDLAENDETRDTLVETGVDVSWWKRLFN